MQEHQHQYPHIFRLVMDIIPIQASSVPCEQVFSSGKQTMTPRRGCISTQLMEALQMLKFSIWKGRPLRFTEGMSWSEELEEFEMIAWTAPLGDAEAYGRSLEEDHGKGAQKSYGNSSGWEVRWDWGRGPDKLWALVWVKEFDEMRKGHRQVMGTHLGQGELDKMGKGPRRAVGAHLGQWESDDMGKDVRGCFTSSNVSSDISLSPLYIPPHCR